MFMYACSAQGLDQGLAILFVSKHNFDYRRRKNMGGDFIDIDYNVHTVACSDELKFKELKQK